MLRTLDELHDYMIGAVDGVIGHVKDLYLDDEAWGVRYLAVDTGGWLSGRKVLISPMAIGELGRQSRLGQADAQGREGCARVRAHRESDPRGRSPPVPALWPQRVLGGR